MDAFTCRYCKQFGGTVEKDTVGSVGPKPRRPAPKGAQIKQRRGGRLSYMLRYHPVPERSEPLRGWVQRIVVLG